MKHYICVLTLAVFGAVSAYSQITLNPVAERAIGTPQLTVANSPQSPNLVEGREFFAPQSVALDNSVAPPRIYVSDYVNNRVLAWKNAVSFTNGQPADLAVGQPDLLTTFQAGPSAVAQKTSTFTSGVTRPSGLAVDQNGNLYVADGGNNRVLRYPKPFAQTSQFPQPDLWIGQASIGGYNPNYPNGTSTPTAQGLLLASGSTVLTSTLAFDSAGNLWVLDTGNYRVLRFSAGSLATGGGSLTADLVLGQSSFTSNASTLSSTAPASYQVLNQFISPASIAFDPSGNLWVSDLNRVMVFPGPTFSNGMSASAHLLGVFPTGFAFPTGAALQTLLDQTTVLAPEGLFFLPGDAGVGVVDAGYNRIMIFPAFANWPANAPPSETAIVGQPNTCSQSPNQLCKAPNNGNPLTSNSVLAAPAGVACTKSQPTDVACTGGDLFLADAGNNRILDLPIQGASLGGATRVLGQDFFNANAANLIEGREFQFSGNFGGANLADASMAIDNSTGTPHLYVADPYNNRVLGFKDLRAFQNGGKNKADVVLGQADFTTALINFPSGLVTSLNSSGLYRPVGLVVDAKGNLYVADSGNGRVLRFPAPFSYTGKAPEPADLVLGQQNFNTTIIDPTSTNMAVPYGVAFSPSCNTPSQACDAPNGLVVSDQYDNRVLYIPTTNGTFVAGADNGKAATVVFGQTSFNQIGAGNSLASLNQPHHISCDTNGNVYVADTNNNRVLVFPSPASPTTSAFGQQAQVIGGLSTPEGVYVSPISGEIWVANTGAANFLRFAGETQAVLGQPYDKPIQDTSGNFGYHPLAVIQDQYGDLLGADDAHRVALYFPGIYVENAASFALSTNRPLAPGAIATIYSVFTCNPCTPTQFLASDTKATSYPVQSTLADVQVLVNGTPSPLYFVNGNQINFIVPSSTPASGSADVQVVQASTGRVLGVAQLPMASYSPGAFVGPGGLVGSSFYAAAINQDGTVNGPGNPAVRGQYVSLYMTGQGVIAGAPPDGVQATSTLSTPYTPIVQVGAVTLSSSQVLYSGLNGLPGVWQVNITIPTSVVPTNGVVPFAVITPDLQPNWNSGSGFVTYLYVK